MDCSGDRLLGPFSAGLGNSGAYAGADVRFLTTLSTLPAWGAWRLSVSASQRLSSAVSSAARATVRTAIGRLWPRSFMS